jgi:hypothetical protein
MKILECKIDPDGNYDLLVQYERTATITDRATIPTRELLAKQGNKEADAMTDDEYLTNAIETLRATLEDPRPVDAAAAARAAALVGQVVDGQAKKARGRSDRPAEKNKP